MTQVSMPQPIANGHIPDDKEMLAVLVWHVVKNSGESVSVLARRADLRPGAIYKLMSGYSEGFSQARYSRLEDVLPELRGLAARLPNTRVNASVAVTAKGISLYNELVMAGNAVLFREDEEYHLHKTRSPTSAAVLPEKTAPKTSPRTPTKAAKKVVAVPRQLPLDVLGDMLWMLSDQKRRQRLERVAAWLKDNNAHLSDLLQAAPDESE